MIKPTPGRIVWYFPAKDDAFPQVNDQPLAAIVVAVHDDYCVNLAVFGADGTIHPRQNVPLAQNGDVYVTNEHRCEWMPYQKAVAAGQTPPVLHAVPGPAGDYPNTDRPTDQ